MRQTIAVLIIALLFVCVSACGETAAPADASAAGNTAAATTEAPSVTESTRDPATGITEPSTSTSTSHTAQPSAIQPAPTMAQTSTTTKSTTTTKKTSTTTKAQNSVPKEFIGSKKSGELTWDQYQEARAEAERLVLRYAGQPRSAQLEGVYTQLRAIFDAGMTYSMEDPHYADPYGYLILKRASCAGSARTAGLCLDVLGIPWEHVNAGGFTHQWARVKVGNEYWICDPYGMYVGPEPEPYVHPYLE